MKTDKFGIPIFSENDLLDLCLSNIDIALDRVVVDKKIEFNRSLNLEKIPKLIEYHIDQSLTVEEFDSVCMNNWFMSEEYKTFDIASYVLDKCSSPEELQRAGQELMLFQERDMFVLLRYLKYLVDTMRANNIVWGVGRGSSIASFVLYLIGVHRINSLYYDLDIHEFLK